MKNFKELEIRSGEELLKNWREIFIGGNQEVIK
jgi:hypothetical protein